MHFFSGEPILHLESTLIKCLCVPLILQADPSDSHSWLALALVESRRGCKSEARAIFEKGTHNCPESVHLWQVNIIPLMNAGAYFCHLHLLMSTLTSKILASFFPPSTKAWAMLEAKSGAHDSARAKFAKGLALDPGNSFVCHAWGQLEASQGDAKRARALYQQALAFGPQPQVIAALAELELAAGDFEAARELFRTGIDGDASSSSSSSSSAESFMASSSSPANTASKSSAGAPAAGAGVESAMRPANWAEMSTTQKKNWRGRQNRAAKEREAGGKDSAGQEGSSSSSKAVEAPSTTSKPKVTASVVKKKQSSGAEKKDERMDAAPLLRAWAMLEENRFHDQV